MQPHKQIKDILTIIAVCAPPENTSWQWKNLYWFVGASITFVLISGSTSAVVIASQSEFETALCFISDTIALMCGVFTLTTGFLSRKQLRELFEKIEQNYEQCIFIIIISFLWPTQFWLLFFSGIRSQGRRQCQILYTVRKAIRLLLQNFGKRRCSGRLQHLFVLFGLERHH